MFFKKLYKSYEIGLFFIITANLALSFYIDFFWGLIYIIWNIIGLIQIYTRIFNSNIIRVIWYLNFFITPIIKNFLSLSLLELPRILNTLEHLLLSIGLYILLYPILNKIIFLNIQTKAKYLLEIIIGTSIINLLGILNEFSDFLILILENKLVNLNNRYLDTIFDLSSNLIGSLIASIVIIIIKSKSN